MIKASVEANEIEVTNANANKLSPRSALVSVSLDCSTMTAWLLREVPNSVVAAFAADITKELLLQAQKSIRHKLL